IVIINQGKLMNENNWVLMILLIGQLVIAAVCYGETNWTGGIMFSISSIFTGYLILRGWNG
ncbi:MAG TPA: hypothetical protein VEP90_04255, partial [Methylomirabilota bacterium]|nr:hypothetical protein [Methylomirabilota bacterium]